MVKQIDRTWGEANFVSTIYLDNNATTRPLPEVQEAVLRTMCDIVGNPSSTHSSGEKAFGAIESARSEVAQLLGAEAEQIIFFSGGTEANNTVLRSALSWCESRPTIVTSVVEHSSILKLTEALSKESVVIVELGVDERGFISLDDLERALRHGAKLVSVQWVNNETGVIQPIHEIGALCRHYGVMFHTDAAQAVGKLPIDLEDAPIDFLSLSGHKFHGPLGVGGLFARDTSYLRPILHGGSQEKGLHPGTENVPAIVGLGVAAQSRRIGLDSSLARLRELRDRLEELILTAIPTASVNGASEARAPNSCNLRFPKIDGQALVARLDAVGICCSQSSACNSARPEPSYVLRAMGLTEDDAYSSVRFSVSVENTFEEMDRTAESIAEIHCNLRTFFSPRESRSGRAEVS